MSREKDLVKNTFLLSLGRFLPKLVNIITLPIVTACLTKSEYGTYDLISTLVMLLMPIATLQIQSAAFRFLIDYRDDAEQSSVVISNILAVVCPISFIVSLGIIIFYPGFGLPFKIILAIYFFADSLETTVAQIARGLGNNKAYSISSIVLSWINGAGIVLVLKLMNTGLLGVVVSLGVANIIALIYLCVTIKIWQFLKFSIISREMILEMLGYSWPLIPNNLSNWVLKLSDRLVITAYLGLESTAVYAVANKIPNILSIAHTVIVNAWQENASIAVNDIDSCEYYSKIFDYIFCLMIGFTALLIACTPMIFLILIRGDYADAYIQMPILILAMFFSCMAGFQGGIYVAHKRTKSVGITTMAAAGINLLIDVLLINRIGITAGALSTLVAYVFLYLFRVVNMRKFQPIKYKLKKQCVLFLVIAVMLVLCFMMNFYLNCINFVIGIIVFSVLNKDLIKKFAIAGGSILKKRK